MSNMPKTTQRDDLYPLKPRAKKVNLLITVIQILTCVNYLPIGKNHFLCILQFST